MLFKGKSHLKRMTGISVINEKLYLRWNYNSKEMTESIKNIFLKSFKSCINKEYTQKSHIHYYNKYVI